MVTTIARSVLALTLAGAAGLGLSACSSGTPAAPPTTSAVPTVTQVPPPQPPVTVTEVETPTATPTPTPTPTADAGAKVGLTCKQLITPQTMYDFNPNFSRSDRYAPKSGTRAATIAGYKGLTCEWINDSSNEKIDISVARLQPATLSQFQAKLAKTSKSTTVFGTKGYFTVSGTKGQADAFTSDYWIAADSDYFAEASDAKQLIAAAIAALR